MEALSVRANTHRALTPGGFSFSPHSNQLCNTGSVEPHYTDEKTGHKADNFPWDAYKCQGQNHSLRALPVLSSRLEGLTYAGSGSGESSPGSSWRVAWRGAQHVPEGTCMEPRGQLQSLAGAWTQRSGCGEEAPGSCLEVELHRK